MCVPCHTRNVKTKHIIESIYKTCTANTTEGLEKKLLKDREREFVVILYMDTNQIARSIVRYICVDCISSTATKNLRCNMEFWFDAIGIDIYVRKTICYE